MYRSVSTALDSENPRKLGIVHASAGSEDARKLVGAHILIVGGYTTYTTWSFFFFFQAEDGIRDLTVTGVQTCALPIWPLRIGIGKRSRQRLNGLAVRVPSGPAEARSAAHQGPSQEQLMQPRRILARNQIGRASCRERV